MARTIVLNSTVRWTASGWVVRQVAASIDTMLFDPTSSFSRNASARLQPLFVPCASMCHSRRIVERPTQRMVRPRFVPRVPSHSDKGLDYIIPGSFSDYPWYIVDKSYHDDFERYRTFDRPEEMASAYREVQKYLRRNGRWSYNHTWEQPGPWILQDAMRMHKSGVRLGVGDAQCVPRETK